MLRDLRPEVELLFVGSSHGPEGDIARANGFDFRPVPSSPLTKSVSFRNAASLLRLAAGMFRARRILKDFRPGAVVGTGGYTTAAVLLAARSIRSRIVIHEQNAAAGRTNKWLARFADKVCVSFESSSKSFPERKVVITGLPIRREFQSLPDKREARRRLELGEGLFTILILGGSQGARRVNELVIKTIPKICGVGAQILHQVGERNVQDVRAKLELLYGSSIDNLPYYLKGYVDSPVAMAAADMVIGRSGAATLAEINAAGLPGILIPYPHAVANEQRLNADYLADHGAAIVFDEANLSSETLTAAVEGLILFPERLSAMADASKSLARPDAAKDVAQIALDLA